MNTSSVLRQEGPYRSLFFLVILFFFSPTPLYALSADLSLSQAEREWLQTHQTIRVQLAEDWPPYNYTEDDRPRGYVNDYMLLLSDKLGLEVDFVRGRTWNEYVRMLEDKELDCITNMTITPERKKRFLFSERHVVNVFNALLTMKGNAKQADLERLHDKILAVPAGYAQEELLRQHYPDITLLLTENLLDSVRQVMAGKADAAIGAHAVFNYYIAHNLLKDVVSVPITGNIIFPSAPHHLAVHPDNALLLNLLDKAAATVTDEEHLTLRRKWYLTNLPEKPLQLSSREQDYLADKQLLRVCVDPDWMPIESIRNGRHTGMAADYLQLLAEKIGIEIRLEPTNSWKQTLRYAKSRRCDLISLAMSTPERRLYLHFSDPYFKTPLVVATSAERPFIGNLASLEGERLGVKKDYAFGPRLEAQHPNITLVEIASLEQGLRKVRNNELYGIIGALPTIAYAIQQNYADELKIAGNTGEQLELSMALRNDEPLLLAVMNKAIASITEAEHQKILNRWVSVTYEESTDYGLLLRTVSIGVIIIALLLYRQLTLKKFNTRLRQQNEEILHQSELLQKTQEQLLMTQHAVDSCQFPICWIHYHPSPGTSSIVHANKAAATTLGYSLDEFLSLQPEKIATDFTDGTIIKDSFSIDGASSPTTTVFRRKDGSTFPVELHVSNFTYADQQYLFIFFNDITMQREMKARLHRSMKMEAVGMMAGGVAHDLNNILSGIVSYPELLLLKLAPDHEMRPQLEAIQRSGQQAAAIVDDLLTMARGAAAVREVANLNILLKSYFDSPEFQKLQANHPRVRCSLHLANNLSNINCSPLHINKSIMNLVTNGYEATPPEGTVRLATSNLRVDEPTPDNQYLPPGNYVMFEVKDSGPGIPEEIIGHIFEPFYSKKEMGRSGTGLGLSIVWNTVQDHDGRVTVKNDTTGARFRLILPATEAEITVLPEKEVREELKGKGENVLIVDDEPQQLDIAAQMLRALQYSPTTAKSGREAIELLAQREYPLILLDMIMRPGMSGRETYAEVLLKHPQQKAIIVSGFSEDSEIQKTLDMGAASFVRKPYSMHQLAVAVKEALV